MLTLVDVRVRASGQTAPLLEIPRLEVSAGERIVVHGLSGAGKSLLLSVLAGALAAGAPGELTLTGRRETTGCVRVGWVPQRSVEALHPLVPLGRQLRLVTGANRTRTSDVLGRVGLGDPRIAQRRPAELSGGQAQRAAVALAVLSGADLVVADEPTSALDPQTRDEVLSLLTGALRPGEPDATAPALVVSTHDAAVSALLGARRLDVVGGRIVADTPAPGAAALGAPLATGAGS